MKSVSEYPPELQETVKTLRKLQSNIDRNDKANDKLRQERDEILDALVDGGMGPKEAMEIVGLGRNAYYQRHKKAD